MKKKGLVSQVKLQFVLAKYHVPIKMAIIVGSSLKFMGIIKGF